MNRYHAAVWLDHAHAKIFHFDAQDWGATEVKSAHGAAHLHHKAGAAGAGHAAEDPKFYAAIETALADAKEILVMGPGNAKTVFHKHAVQHQPALAKRIVAVESADHPSDGELVAHARKHFKAIDRMTPQRG